MLIWGDHVTFRNRLGHLYYVGVGKGRIGFRPYSKRTGICGDTVCTVSPKNPQYYGKRT